MTKRKLPEDLGNGTHIDHFDFLMRMPAECRFYIPAVTAIYFLHDNSGFVFYIGSSTNLKSRMGSHKGLLEQLQRAGANKLSIAWLPISTAQYLRILEETLIERVKPPLNGIHKRIYSDKTRRRNRSYSYVDAVLLAKRHARNLIS